MRIAYFAVTTTLVCGLAFGASKQQSITYVEGNLTGIIPNSGGSLNLSGPEAIEIKTGLATVAVPWSSIAKAELGAIRELDDSQPLYKVWALHKRLTRAESQLVKIEFKSEEGEQKNLTIELEKSAAPELVETILEHNKTVQTNLKTSVADSAKPGAWWGDNYWKTTRNTETWSKPAESK